MSRGYIARDPRTGKRIGVGKRKGEKKTGIAALYPERGPWQRLEVSEILPLATGKSDKVEILADGKRWKLGRIDAIKALSKVRGTDVEMAYETLVDALEDDFPDVRIAALKVLPSFALRRQGILLHCLSDRLLDDEEAVREEAMGCLKKIAPLFPSGCEEMIRRELREQRKAHRDNAFEALKLTAREWPEVGCLHLDEIIREVDVDLRIRGSLILRTVASKGGAEAWDLITWSLQDEEVRVRRNAAKTLTILADVEPRVAVILVESSLGESDRAIRNYVIKALKKLLPVGNRDRLDGHGDNPLRENRGLKSYRAGGVRNGIAGRGVSKADHRQDAAGPGLRELLTMVGMHKVELLGPVLLSGP